MTVNSNTSHLPKKKVYFISGLGADRTVFKNLDLSFCEPVFLDWITPFKKESLQHYALRLAEAIKEPDATIVGLSMGGMMASEIIKAHPSMRAVIISSNRCAKEFPKYTRFLTTYLPAYQLNTKGIMRVIFPITSWFLGAENEADRKHLWGAIDRINLPFLKWCIWAIANWRLPEPQPNIIHIHGMADRVLPYRYVKPDYTIKGGGHLMIMNRAAEISELLKKLCEDQAPK
jgi:pimeloyl-ACP methyl ester carboxylesterase